MDLNLALAQR